MSLVFILIGVLVAYLALCFLAGLIQGFIRG
jgi:hypothetical protein